MKKTSKKRGFTIVELVIVVGVIGILSAILIPTFINLVDKSRTSATAADCVNAFKMYQIDAQDGYVGDEEDYDPDIKSDYEIRIVGQDQIFFSAEKNAELAKENAYHFADGKWVKGNPNKLLSVCMSYDYNAAQYGRFYAFVEQAALTNIAINPAPSGGITMRTSMAIDLLAQPEPKNAAIEHPVWLTSNDAAVSVENGTIRGEGAGASTITIFDDTNENGALDEGEISQTVNVTIENTPITPEEVVAIEPPAAVAEYDANTAVLDSTSAVSGANLTSRTKALSKNRISRNTFFRNEDGSRDVYKVGYRNPFKFDFVAMLSLGEGQLKEFGAYAISPYAPIIKQWDEGTSNWVAVTDDSAVIDHGLIRFTADANEQRYKVTVSGFLCEYNFEFEVFDAWNIYTENELALFDNRDLIADNAHYVSDANQSATFGDSDPTLGVKAVDYWEGFRKDSFGNNNISSSDVKGLALHANLQIKDRNINNYVKYTASDIATYKSMYPNDYKDWLKNLETLYKNFYGNNYKVRIDGEKELIGSLKDDLAIYARNSEVDDDFVFEGNYFTIDFSTVKPVYAYHTYGNNSNDPIKRGKLAEAKIETHGGLLGINVNNVFNNSKASVYGEVPQGGGTYTFNNLHTIGNGALDNNPIHKGGLATFKVSAVTFNANNVIANKAYIAFQGGANWNILNQKQGSNYIYPSETVTVNGVTYKDVTDSRPWTHMHLDRCKTFDAFNSAFYLGATDATTSNSWFQDAGGALFMLDELHYGDYTNNGTRTETSGDFRYHRSASVDATNTFMENWVQGTEPWFEINNATMLVAQIAMIGAPTGWFGANAIEHGDHKSFVKVENGIPKLNFIALDFNSSNMLDNSFTHGRALEGHFRVKENELDPGFALDFNTETNPLLNTYFNQLVAKGGVDVVTIMTSAGGHGTSYPIEDSEQALGYDLTSSGLAYLGTYDIPGIPMPIPVNSVVMTGIPLSYQITEPLTEAITAALAEQMEEEAAAAEAATYVPQIVAYLQTYVMDANYDNLASGNYASIYFRPGAVHNFGMFLGMA